jgi:transposase
MYSMIESAKANEIEPYQYLRFLFTNLPLISGKDSLRSLLPCYIKEKQLMPA